MSRRDLPCHDSPDILSNIIIIPQTEMNLISLAAARKAQGEASDRLISKSLPHDPVSIRGDDGSAAINLKMLHFTFSCGIEAA